MWWTPIWRDPLTRRALTRLTTTEPDIHLWLQSVFLPPHWHWPLHWSIRFCKHSLTLQDQEASKGFFWPQSKNFSKLTLIFLSLSLSVCVCVYHMPSLKTSRNKKQQIPKRSFKKTRNTTAPSKRKGGTTSVVEKLTGNTENFYKLLLLPGGK